MTNWGHWKYQVMVLGAWCDYDNEVERNRCYMFCTSTRASCIWVLLASLNRVDGIAADSQKGEVVVPHS